MTARLLSLSGLRPKLHCTDAAHTLVLAACTGGLEKTSWYCSDICGIWAKLGFSTCEILESGDLRCVFTPYFEGHKSVIARAHVDKKRVIARVHVYKKTCQHACMA